MSVSCGSSPDGRSRAVADGVVAQVTEHLAQPFPLLVAASLLGVAAATVPGGVSEICITSKVLQFGVPLVTVCHVLRVVVLTVCAQWRFGVFRRLVTGQCWGRVRRPAR